MVIVTGWLIVTRAWADFDAAATGPAAHSVMGSSTAKSKAVRE
ncbi:hypothetical protein [Parasphingorhabdus sp.]